MQEDQQEDHPSEVENFLHEEQSAAQIAGGQTEHSEESSIPLPRRVKVGISFNIEIFRLIGLSGIVVLLLLGTVITDTAVVYPPKGPDNPDGAFIAEKTYIYQLFHFNHTCNVLDFNPSKSISALLVMFTVVPLCLFTVLSYLRIREDYEQGHVAKWLLTFSTIVTPINFCCFLYFYMVFVNSPLDKKSFILHYLPFMFYQLALMLTAFEQCFYVIEKKLIPLNAPIWTVKVYLAVLVPVCLFYTIFVWSFIADAPIMNTTKAGQRGFAMFIMYLFDLLAVVFPASMAAYHCWHTDRFHQRSYIAYYDADSL